MPFPARLDTARLTLARPRIDDLAAYDRVCGFPLGNTVPPTFPHLLTFPLQLALMTDRAFPFPAIGTVHLENSITQHRPVAVDELLQVTVSAQDLRGHRKGLVFDLVTKLHSRGEPVWEETSTFLRRGAGGSGAAADQPGPTRFPEAPAGTDSWELPGDLGRRYAAVSGDRNPIHLYPLTAKAFGFRRQIAHGMWSLARCLAAVADRLPGAVRVDATFRKPVVLPSTVSFGAYGDAAGDGLTFALSRADDDGSPHLVGRAGRL
jgi:acyl dehydratase